MVEGGSRSATLVVALVLAGCAGAGDTTAEPDSSDSESASAGDDGPAAGELERVPGPARPPATAHPEPQGLGPADPPAHEPLPPCPDHPEDLATFLLGNPEDAAVPPTGPAWLLAGGTPAPYGALKAWSSHAAGGDVVMLRTEPIDTYLQLFWDHMEGVDSVELITIQSPEQARLESVACRLARAEAIYVLGGWQGTYLDNWSQSSIPAAIDTAWARGAAIGGNSAGLAVMGEYVFGAHSGTIYSDEALADPYSPKITLDTGFLHMPLGRGVLFDTHFTERDRMGRSIAFLARIMMEGWDDDPRVVAIDEDTALSVDDQGLAQVHGSGSVYVLAPPGPPVLCSPGLPLEFDEIQVYALSEGQQLWLPDGITDVEPLPVSASDGMLDPADPY